MMTAERCVQLTHETARREDQHRNIWHFSQNTWCNDAQDTLQAIIDACEASLHHSANRYMPWQQQYSDTDFALLTGPYDQQQKMGVPFWTDADPRTVPTEGVQDIEPYGDYQNSAEDDKRLIGLPAYRAN